MLGTVQFGLDYGVSNARGQVAGDEVARILDLAAREAEDASSVTARRNAKRCSGAPSRPCTPSG